LTISPYETENISLSAVRKCLPKQYRQQRNIADFLACRRLPFLANTRSELLSKVSAT
jgi:hypothetical protein